MSDFRAMIESASNSDEPDSTLRAISPVCVDGGPVVSHLNGDVGDVFEEENIVSDDDGEIDHDHDEVENQEGNEILDHESSQQSSPRENNTPTHDTADMTDFGAGTADNDDFGTISTNEVTTISTTETVADDSFGACVAVTAADDDDDFGKVEAADIDDMASYVARAGAEALAAGGPVVYAEVSMDEIKTLKLFVGGLRPSTTDSTFSKFFSRFGEMTDCVLMKGRSGNKGFGFVTYKDKSSVYKVLNGKIELDSKRCSCYQAIPKNKINVPTRHAAVEGSAQGGARSKKLYIGSLDTSVTDRDLREYFKKFGHVDSANIIYNKDDSHSGSGVVILGFANDVERIMAQKVHSFTEGGPPMKVEYVLVAAQSDRDTTSPTAVDKKTRDGGSAAASSRSSSSRSRRSDSVRERNTDSRRTKDYRDKPVSSGRGSSSGGSGSGVSRIVALRRIPVADKSRGGTATSRRASDVSPVGGSSNSRRRSSRSRSPKQAKSSAVLAGQPLIPKSRNVAMGAPPPVYSLVKQLAYPAQTMQPISRDPRASDRKHQASEAVQEKGESAVTALARAKSEAARALHSNGPVRAGYISGVTAPTGYHATRALPVAYMQEVYSLPERRNPEPQLDPRQPYGHYPPDRAPVYGLVTNPLELQRHQAEQYYRERAGVVQPTHPEPRERGPPQSQQPYAHIGRDQIVPRGREPESYREPVAAFQTQQNQVYIAPQPYTTREQNPASAGSQNTLPYQVQTPAASQPPAQYSYPYGHAQPGVLAMSAPPAMPVAPSVQYNREAAPQIAQPVQHTMYGTHSPALSTVTLEGDPRLLGRTPNLPNSGPTLTASAYYRSKPAAQPLAAPSFYDRRANPVDPNVQPLQAQTAAPLLQESASPAYSRDPRLPLAAPAVPVSAYAPQYTGPPPTAYGSYGGVSYPTPAPIPAPHAPVDPRTAAYAYGSGVPPAAQQFENPATLYGRR